MSAERQARGPLVDILKEITKLDIDWSHLENDQIPDKSSHASHFPVF
jgi:hypothetical protein